MPNLYPWTTAGTLPSAGKHAAALRALLLALAAVALAAALLLLAKQLPPWTTVFAAPAPQGGPEQPQLVGPENGSERGCYGSSPVGMELTWNPPIAPDSVAEYELEMVKLSSTTGAATTSVRVPPDASRYMVDDVCGEYPLYLWRVRALDTYESASAWSEERLFSVSVFMMASTPTHIMLRQPDDNTVLSCSTNGSGSAALRWSPMGDPLESYQIEYAPLTGSMPVSNTLSVDDNEAALSLACGARYQWRVRAVDPFGSVSGWSGTRKFTIARAAPQSFAAPRLLEPSSETALLCPSGGSVATTLRWQPDSSVTPARWEVELSQTPRPNLLETRSKIPLPSTSTMRVSPDKNRLDVNLTCGTTNRFNYTYRWRVRAVGAGENSGGWSEERVVTLAPVELLARPIPLDPTSDSKILCAAGSTVKAALHWQEPTSKAGTITGYDVELAKMSQSPLTVAISSTVTLNSPDLETTRSIACGSTYNWRVRAIYSQGEKGVWSWPSKFTLASNVQTPAATTAFGPPDGTEYVCPANSFVPISLQARTVGGNVKYEFEIKWVEPSSTRLTDSLTKTDTPSLARSFTCGTRLTWQVRTVGADNTLGAWSGPRTIRLRAIAKAGDSKPPPAPTMLTPGVANLRQAGSVKCDPVNLQWNTVSDASGIFDFRAHLYKYNAARNVWYYTSLGSHDVSGSQTSLQSTLDTNARYAWVVAVTDNAGNTSRSEFRYFNCGSNPGPLPVTLPTPTPIPPTPIRPTPTPFPPTAVPPTAVPPTAAPTSPPATTAAPTAAPPTPVPPSTLGSDVYVTSIALEPADPKRGDFVTFHVDFLNTTGAPRAYRWFVKLFQPDRTNAFGETAKLNADIPPGASTLVSPNNWRVAGPGDCLTLRARVFWSDAEQNVFEFPGVSGDPAYQEFTVCPR